MIVRFKSPMFHDGKTYEQFVEAKDENGKIVKAGVQYEVTPEDMKAIDKNDYVVVTDAKIEEGSTKGAPKKAQNK